MAVECLPCTVDYHSECWIPADTGKCCCTIDTPTPMLTAEPNDPLEKRERGGQIKEAGNVGDLESTGRKRAAKLYPIPKEGQPGYPLPCEWQGLANAGGGVVPIVGCITGLAKNIHHGPDKNTLSNFVGNVHRICPTCHNRWHARNDPYYSSTRPKGDTAYVPLEEYEWVKHDGLTRATPEQIADSEIFWGSTKAKEIKDEVV